VELRGLRTASRPEELPERCKTRKGQLAEHGNVLDEQLGNLSNPLEVLESKFELQALRRKRLDSCLEIQQRLAQPELRCLMRHDKEVLRDLLPRRAIGRERLLEGEQLGKPQVAAVGKFSHSVALAVGTRGLRFAQRTPPNPQALVVRGSVPFRASISFEYFCQVHLACSRKELDVTRLAVS
jgi:hypothetical protein